MFFNLAGFRSSSHRRFLMLSVIFAAGHWRHQRRRNETSSDEKDDGDDSDDVISGGNETTGATTFGDRGGDDEAELTRFDWNRSWGRGLRKAEPTPSEVFLKKSVSEVMTVAVVPNVVNLSKQWHLCHDPSPVLQRAEAWSSSANKKGYLVAPLVFENHITPFMFNKTETVP